MKRRGTRTSPAVAASRSSVLVRTPPVATPSLPLLDQSITSARSLSDRPFKILVRMPTRSRPEQAVRTLAAYREMAGAPVDIEVVVDSDDASMRRLDVLRALRDLGCIITVGEHRTKVEAVNGGRVQGWDVLVLASDDMVPVYPRWAERVTADMIANFPLLDGAIHYNDGFAGSKLCTIPVMGRRLYEQFGYVYYTAYRSMWCDNEQTEVLCGLGRLAYVDSVVFEHRHPAAGKSVQDALYHRNGTKELWDTDEGLYRQRRKMVRIHAQQGFDMPPLWLSICMASLPSRRAMRERLVDELFRQIVDNHLEFQVEVLLDDREGVTTGAKRAALNERARGHFVVAVDDDDWVSTDYVSRIVGAIEAQPNSDCVEMHGLVDIVGQARPFHHSVCYEKWFESDGVYRRSPNHLNPVRRELALKAGYPDKTVGEDAEYSTRLRPLLKVEAPIGEEPLYFYLPSQGARS